MHIDPASAAGNSNHNKNTVQLSSAAQKPTAQLILPGPEIMPHILLLGTLDTKLAETLYVYEQLQAQAKQFSTPLQITLIDCGRENTQHDAITISHKDLVAKYAPADGPLPNLSNTSRGEVIGFLTTCVTRCVTDRLSTTSDSSPIHGIIGTGGSGGTSLISAVMRNAAPIGLPKLIVSTIASGDTSSLVAECDITLMYSVVDIAGTNELLKEVLGNAAGAIWGMANVYERRIAARQSSPGRDEEGKNRKTRVGITMFGVTTPCVDAIRRHLEEKYSVEVYVFHATGHGGKAMERLVSENHLDAILDITTTEIADYIAGGNMACAADRLEATLKRGIPNIISLGATDMVNFGARESVPEKYKGRRLEVHNPSVTLMRTEKAEGVRIAEFIVEKIKRFAKEERMVEVWFPEGGISIMSKAGGAFEDREVDKALFEALKEGLKDTRVRIVSKREDVNDEQFAIDVAERLMGLVKEVQECI